jgi:hypothetical protein
VRKWNMSANLAVTWPLGMISVSDRQLTGLVAGEIKTNRSTKMTVLGCADAHGVIVYNGIGMDDDGKTPKRPVFRELLCGICGSPIPASHRVCEVCSYEQHSDKSKKRSRRRT